MSEEEKKGSFFKRLIVILLLLVVAGGAVASLVPLVDCTICGGSGSNEVKIPRIGWTASPGCECKGGKMTLVQKYRLEATKKALLR